MEPKNDKNRVERRVANKFKVYAAWEALQSRVRSGYQSDHIGDKTYLGFAGDYVAIYRKPRTSIADFEKEARAIGLLK